MNPNKLKCQSDCYLSAVLHEVDGIEPREWIDETAVENKVSSSKTNDTATDKVIELGEKFFIISVHNLLHHGC